MAQTKKQKRCFTTKGRIASAHSVIDSILNSYDEGIITEQEHDALLGVLTDLNLILEAWDENTDDLFAK